MEIKQNKSLALQVLVPVFLVTRLLSSFPLKMIFPEKQEQLRRVLAPARLGVPWCLPVATLTSGPTGAATSLVQEL